MQTYALTEFALTETRKKESLDQNKIRANFRRFSSEIVRNFTAARTLKLHKRLAIFSVLTILAGFCAIFHPEVATNRPTGRQIWWVRVEIGVL